MAEVSETKLPGVGVRYDLATEAGPRVGVLVHRSGRRDLLFYSERDPSACDRTIELDPEESLALAEILGATRVAEQLTALQQDIQASRSIGYASSPAPNGQIAHSATPRFIRQRGCRSSRSSGATVRQRRRVPMLC
jgi:hypothetical protein